MAEVDWPLAMSIVGRGLALVFGIMILLAGVTSVMGRIIRGLEARKKVKGEAK